MPDRTGILVVGGYGVVGSRVSRRLASLFPDRVVIAGRDLRSAAELSYDLGAGTRARQIDLDVPASIAAAMENIGTVMVCVAQREPHLLRAAVARGAAYTDIAPRLAFWHGARALSDEARRTGARVVLGAGLSPGVSNMMARQLAGTLGKVDRIETSILLSLGDQYGPDSMHHIIDSLVQPFTVMRDGIRRSAVPFSDGRRVTFPAPIGTRTAYVFPWSDVVYYPETLGVHTAIGRFALDPPWTSALISTLVKAGMRRWLTHSGFQRGNRRVVDRVKERYAGQDRFALVVSVEGNGRTASMSIAGRHQAAIASTSAAEFARALAAGEVTQAGVWLPEEAIPHEPFFAALADLGWKVTQTQSSFAVRTSSASARSTPAGARGADCHAPSGPRHRDAIARGR